MEGLAGARPAGKDGVDTNALVRQTAYLVEGMEHLKEDARKLYRYMKRAEVLVSDLRPYAAKMGDTLAASLAIVEKELTAVKRMLEDCASKGKISAYMQADFMLHSFTVATRRMDAALGQLPITAAPELMDTAEDVKALRTMLQRATYTVPEAHLEQLKQYRAACDEIKAHAAGLEEKCKDILQQVSGERVLSRTDYCASVGDLQREIRTLRAYAIAAASDSASAAGSAPHSARGEPGSAGAGDGLEGPPLGTTELPMPGAETRETAESSAYYLRVLLDVIRVAHDVEDENVPLEFLCPLSTLIMHDPVVLMESGHSFERQALVDWWANGHRMCPKTGIPLKANKLMIAPNVQLKEAIHRWAEGGDMALRFRPLLRLLSTASDSNSLLQQPHAPPSGATALAGHLNKVLGPAGSASSGAGTAAAAGAANGEQQQHVPVSTAAVEPPAAAGVAEAVAVAAAPQVAAAPAPAPAAAPIGGGSGAAAATAAVIVAAAEVAGPAPPAPAPAPAPMPVGGGSGAAAVAAAQAQGGAVAARVRQWS